MGIDGLNGNFDINKLFGPNSESTANSDSQQQTGGLTKSEQDALSANFSFKDSSQTEGTEVAKAVKSRIYSPGESLDVKPWKTLG